MTKTYEEQVQEQIEQYRDTDNMHDLPAVFHVWSSDFVLPQLQKIFSVNDINGFYVEAFLTAASHNYGLPRFLSLGCGDGAVEIQIAKTLLERGLGHFRFTCFDLSNILLARFERAIPEELLEHFELLEGDLNAHSFSSKFDCIMANHSLHHIVDLEGIYRTTYDNLADDGIFVTSDMIGRNGHMRWPEAKLMIDALWPFLTTSHRNNILLRRSESQFLDHDCSSEGFEGIRAQEVLPLILKQGFHPHKFFGFGGFIDVFVDRCFGPNFNMSNSDDNFLARRLAFLNEIFLDAGLVKPTMMLAYFTKKTCGETCYRARTAERSVRDTERDPAWLTDALEDFARIPANPAYVFRAPRPSAQEDPAQRTDHGPQHQLLQKALIDALAALRHVQQASESDREIINKQAQRIAAIETSTSWQLTAPLRTVIGALRRTSSR